MNKVLKVFQNILIFSVGVTALIFLFGQAGFLSEKNPKISLPPTFSITPTPTSRPAVKGVNFTPTILPTTTPKPNCSSGNKLFNLVNEYRAKNGLKPLVVYSSLCEFAKIRSEQIQNNWSHNGYEQAAGQGALFSTVCPDCSQVAENLAKDYPNEEAVLQAWIVSTFHKSNLEGDWDWGCAVYSSNNYATFLFGKKK